MTTQEIKDSLRKYGVEVKRVTNRLGKKIVTIDWKDYLKVVKNNNVIRYI